MTEPPAAGSGSEARGRIRLAILLLLIPMLAIVGGDVVRRMWKRAPLGGECGLGVDCGFGAFCHPRAHVVIPAGFCTHACDADADCPGELRCSAEPPRLCVERPSRDYGGQCSDDYQCHSNLCMGFETQGLPNVEGDRPPAMSRAFCTRSCTGAEDCPQGDRCEPYGARQVCNPARQIDEAYRRFLDALPPHAG